MNLTQILQQHTAQVINGLYQLQISPAEVQIGQTDAKFEGDLTVLVFPLVKLTKQKPADLAQALGAALCSQFPAVFSKYNAVAGFCNVSFADSCWVDYLLYQQQNPFQPFPANGKTVLVEYSSPNTNKPLHLGHIRNNLLGFSVSNILKAAGYGVKMVQIINDRGVHICKSMLAWQLFGNGETPSSAQIKGDHLVGKYYVRFESEFQSEYKLWQQSELAQTLLNNWLSKEKDVAKAQKEVSKQTGKLSKVLDSVREAVILGILRKNGIHLGDLKGISKALKEQIWLLHKSTFQISFSKLEREQLHENLKSHLPARFYDKINAIISAICDPIKVIDFLKHANKSYKYAIPALLSDKVDPDMLSGILKAIDAGAGAVPVTLKKEDKDRIWWMHVSSEMNSTKVRQGWDEVKRLVSLRRSSKNRPLRVPTNAEDTFLENFMQFLQEEQANWEEFSLITEGGEPLIGLDGLIDKFQNQEDQNTRFIDELLLPTYFFKEVYKNTYFNEHSSLGKQCKEMLQGWEQQNPEIIALWEKMNGWVYEGFGQTYERLGVYFDKLYYESQTYLKGKELVEQNLASESSIFYQEQDGSTWIDLTAAKLDKKVVLRGDGTSMYITQDLGTAWQRFKDFDMDAMIYVVGNEQEYHFQVLFEILKRLGFKFSQQCQHLSYGMVNLPSGRMKSREGTVVDADDLIALLVDEVSKESQERATLSDLSADEQAKIWEKVALAALKFFILKVEPKKTMIFDPSQSIDLQGQTGPYIQNAYVRTCGLARKAANLQDSLQAVAINPNQQLEGAEKELLKMVLQLPATIQTAAQGYNPAEVANYLYNLARAFHRFYNDIKIVDKDNLPTTKFRLSLAQVVADTLQYAGNMLGISMPSMM